MLSSKQIGNRFIEISTHITRSRAIWVKYHPTIEWNILRRKDRRPVDTISVSWIQIEIIPGELCSRFTNTIS